MRTIQNYKARLDPWSKKKQNLYSLYYGLPFTRDARKYNVSISHGNKFIWYRVAKVATRSMYNHLRERVKLDVEHANKLYIPHTLYPDYFKWSFVRNPWARLVSCWKNKVESSFGYTPEHNLEWTNFREFPEFVKYVSDQDIELCNRHFRLQSALIDHDVIDFIGRLENFDEDFAHVAEKIGIDVEPVNKRNATNYSRGYRSFYTDELAEVVGELYKDDVERFGYTF